MSDRIKVVGAGLAGCEAAWALAKRGVPVLLIDMKPGRMSPAHTSPHFGELVCSNSLKNQSIISASGLLKAEMKLLGSLVLQAAEQTRVPAGGALAVDRERFALYISEAIKNEPLISIEEREMDKLPDSKAIIATGPLTSDALADDISQLIGSLYFYDAAAPLITGESIDMDKAFSASRFESGEGDYINCPLDKDEYSRFYEALINAETAELKEFEDIKVFEGCMPVEIMAKRGFDTLAFGPMKPVGLKDPKTGKRPYAAVQLRRDDTVGVLYNMVGFQTNLKWGEQKRVFSMIPGLERAEFVRYGVMHRNTYIKSPGELTPWFMLKKRPELYFAGQITGVEGYVESAASGIAAAIGAYAGMRGKQLEPLPLETIIGALAAYVSGYSGSDFQPMNANFGLMPPLGEKVRGKKEKYGRYAERSLAALNEWIQRNLED
jgi:methylenetetrahydrofolate--tRNA-(uracil-5-)-methyltransferase